MKDSESHWMRLEAGFSSVMETLGSLEASARQRNSREDLERLGPAHDRAEAVIKALTHEARSAPEDWKAWVAAETAWLEFRLEMRHVIANAGRLRDDYFASMAGHIERLDKEIRKLVEGSDRFRPRTRVAISQEAERLKRRLDVLRAEARRVQDAGSQACETSIRGMGQAWSEVEWRVEETKKRFARPRWRQGREAPFLPTPVL